MGSISCHITPFGIDSLRGGQTHPHVTKPDVCTMVCGSRAPGLNTSTICCNIWCQSGI